MRIFSCIAMAFSDGMRFGVLELEMERACSLPLSGNVRTWKLGREDHLSRFMSLQSGQQHCDSEA